MFEDIELTGIQGENARQLIMQLLNLIDQLSDELRDTGAENQHLMRSIAFREGKGDVLEPVMNF